MILYAKTFTAKEHLKQCQSVSMIVSVIVIFQSFFCVKIRLSKKLIKVLRKFRLNLFKRVHFQFYNSDVRCVLLGIVTKATFKKKYYECLIDENFERICCSV